MDKELEQFSRRQFTKLSMMGLGTIPFLSLNKMFIDSRNADVDLQVHLFSKHLQFLNYDQMSEAAANMGFDGLDLTVRKKGHVLPERVQDDLPLAIKAMRQHGLKPVMMTTNVHDAKNDLDRTVLKTASQLGLTHYRMGWLRYPEDRTITESQSRYQQKFKDLEQLNKELGLIGCYQNHAGTYMGASVWDLSMILSATANENLGSQYDIRHAVVEGGKGWELGLRRIQPYIKTIVIKDFKWGKQNGKWQPINTPLGQGMLDFNRYFSLLKKYKINVPVSLHLEYDLGGAQRGATSITMDKKEVFKYMKDDLLFLREAWKKA